MMFTFARIRFIFIQIGQYARKVFFFHRDVSSVPQNRIFLHKLTTIFKNQRRFCYLTSESVHNTHWIRFFSNLISKGSHKFSNKYHEYLPTSRIHLQYQFLTNFSYVHKKNRNFAFISRSSPYFKIFSGVSTQLSTLLEPHL